MAVAPEEINKEGPPPAKQPRQAGTVHSTLLSNDYSGVQFYVPPWAPPSWVEMQLPRTEARSVAPDSVTPCRQCGTTRSWIWVADLCNACYLSGRTSTSRQLGGNTGTEAQQGMLPAGVSREQVAPHQGLEWEAQHLQDLDAFKVGVMQGLLASCMHC